MYKDGISIVIPVYNGSQTIKKLVNQIINTLNGFSDYEIILIDDKSPDDSLKEIKKLAADSKKVTAIELDNNYGQQNAILCGLRHSSMEYSVIMDDDLEHNPEDIINLLNEIKKGFDVVYALSSKKPEKSNFRNIGSKLRDKIFDVLTDKPKDIKVCSYRIMNRKVVDEVIKADTKFIYISMEILKHTKNISNIEVVYGQRQSSGFSTRKLIKLLLNIVLYYSECKLFTKMRKHESAYKEAAVWKKEK